jgi:hypothetical protein
MRYEGLWGRIVFSDGAADNVSGIMVLVYLKTKQINRPASKIFLNGCIYFPDVIGAVLG